MCVILVATSTARVIIIVFFLSLLIVSVSSFSVVFEVSAILRFLSFLKLCAELWKPEEVLFTSPLLYESF